MTWFDCDYDNYDDGDVEDHDTCCDDEPDYPEFGCACENALIVDTVCDFCIEWLKEQAAS